MAVYPTGSTDTSMNGSLTPEPVVNETVGQAIVNQLPTMAPWQSFLLIMAVSLVLAAVIQIVGSRVVKNLLSRFDRFDDIVFREIHIPIYLSVALGGLYLAIISLGLGPVVNFYVRGFMLTAIILIWGRAFKRVGYQLLEHYEERGEKKDFIPIFEILWLFVIVFCAVFAVLSVWRIDITPLLASAGVAGVVAGFAAQDTVANLFGGFALYLDDTYRIGDMIRFDSSDRGTQFERAMVTDLGIRSTTVVTRDEIQITVPNSVLNSTKVINESAPKKRKRLRVPINIAYGTDLDHFEDVVLDVAEEEEHVMNHPNPRLRFREFGDSSLNYELLCWIENPVLEGRTRHHLNRAIYRQLNAEGITIPFPQRTISYLDDESGHRDSDTLPRKQVEMQRHGQDLPAEQSPDAPSGTEPADTDGDVPGEDTADERDDPASEPETVKQEDSSASSQ